jgi:hypothetical protein
VIRFILSCLIALSMLGSAPAFAAMSAPPAAAQASDCEMPGGVMPDQPADHEKMPCCTSICTMAGMAGIPQPSGADIRELRLDKTPPAIAAVHELDSLDWATVDPPPRA